MVKLIPHRTYIPTSKPYITRPSNAALKGIDRLQNRSWSEMSKNSFRYLKGKAAELIGGLDWQADDLNPDSH